MTPIKVTPQLAEALVNLRGNRDFETFVKGMQEHVIVTTRQALDADGPLQLRAAGATRIMEQWVDVIAKAPETLDKFRNQPKK